MDLNTKEKDICREYPIKAIQMYRTRTGLGLNEARDALEEELGIDPVMYKKVRDRVAFAFYYQDHLWQYDEEESENNFRSALRFWRRMKHSLKMPQWKDGKHSGDCTDEPCSCHRCFMERYYKMAEKIIDLDELAFDEEDPRNGT